MYSLDKLIRTLPLLDENIWNEAARQPGMFFEAGRQRVSKMRVRMRAEAALEHHKASYGLKVRFRKLPNDQRVTEDYIKQKIAISKDYKLLQASLHNAQADEEFTIILLQAYRMRRDGIEIIAQAQLREGAKEAIEMEKTVVQRRLALQARQLEGRRKQVKR